MAGPRGEAGGGLPRVVVRQPHAAAPGQGRFFLKQAGRLAVFAAEAPPSTAILHVNFHTKSGKNSQAAEFARAVAKNRQRNRAHRSRKRSGKQPAGWTVLKTAEAPSPLISVCHVRAPAASVRRSQLSWKRRRARFWSASVCHLREDDRHRCHLAASSLELGQDLGGDGTGFVHLGRGEADRRHHRMAAASIALRDLRQNVSPLLRPPRIRAD